MNNLEIAIENLDRSIDKLFDSPSYVDILIEEYNSNLCTALEVTSSKVKKGLKEYTNNVTGDAKYLAECTKRLKKAIEENRKADAESISNTIIEKANNVLTTLEPLKKFGVSGTLERSGKILIQYLPLIFNLVSLFGQVHAIMDYNKWVKGNQRAVAGYNEEMKKAQALHNANPNDIEADNAVLRAKEYEKYAALFANNANVRAKEAKFYGKMSGYGMLTLPIGFAGGYMVGTDMRYRKMLDMTISNLKLIITQITELKNELEKNGCSNRAKKIVSQLKVTSLHV